MAPDACDEDEDARAALDEEEAASTPASVWLEESSRARAWANLLSPGLPRHRDALGDGLAPRPEVRARLRAHVSSLGPPHTLVLTGPEGSGKTTELAVLADWLRRGGREDPRVDDRFDDDAAPNSGAPSPASSARPLSGRETGTREDTKTTAIAKSPPTSRKGEPPFVLAHSFADASFPQDTAHFLEKACARLKRAFGIAERLPRDAADLPECFARFLERAALHRRVVVIVDACESARCAPCAGVGAAAVAGLDPRENAPSSFSTEERSALETTTSSRKETLDAALDAHLDAHLAASNAHLTDLSAHFKWLPQSPPLAVRFVLACREDGASASSVSGDAGDDQDDTDDHTPRLSVARAVVSGAPASRAVFPMPPMTVEQTRFVLASVSPTALADGARFRDAARGAPNEASRVARSAGSALERGHHHCFETAALVNAAAPHGATPLYARVAAPFVAGLCAATKHGAWVRAGGVGGGDEEDEFSFVGADKRSSADADESLEKGSAVVVPPAVAAAVRASAGTAFGLVYGRLGAFERRADLEPRTLRAVCLALAVARFGVTEREARRVARRVVDDETRRKNVSRRDFSFSTEDTVSSSSFPLASPFRDDAFDATMQALRPWLAPWTTRASWAAERAPFAGDEDLFENLPPWTEEARADDDDDDDDDVPLTFRDAPTRACVLRRYAPPHARSALDGASARRRLHADIAAFFLEEIQKHASSSRRTTRAAAWHCAAAGDYAALASLIGGSPGAVAAFARPGLRSELATTLANGAGRAPPPTSSLLFAAVAENARAWLDAGDDEDDTENHTYDDMSDLERSKRTAWRSGRYAGASLALASLFCWLKAPKAALAALAAARERFGPPRGRSGVTCALALARCEALADLVRAEGFETSEDFVDVDGRLMRLDSALPALAQQASSACETFAAASSGDFSGVFPFPWRETLVECSAFGSAMQSPPTLAALAATARVDVCVLGLGSVETSQTSQRRDGSDVSSPDATSATFAKTNLFDARLEEIRAWRHAALATATPRVSRALTTVLDRASPGSSFLAKHVSETAARGLSFAAEEEKRVHRGFRDERSELDENLRASASTPSAEVFGLLGALRRRRDAFDPRAHPEDARDASDALVAVLSALLGEDHPETGAAKTVAAEAAARAAVDGGFHGFEERREEKNPSELLSSTDTDQYSSQIATIVAWSRPAYAFAERFYGARSLPAARAAWCVAEGARRGSASDSSRGGGASVKSSAPRPSAQSGRVSAGGAGARAARPMYAQALGATVATLGGAHGDTGATFVAAGALSRAERRAEEARALVEEGARVARKNAAAAETERDAVVAAGFGALENARRLCDAGAFEATDGPRITADNHDNNHDLIEHVRLGVETSVAAAEARLRVAELRAGRSFATLALLARDDADTGDARSLTEAEALLRLALACHERADGPGCAASAPTLAALGRCATERRRAEEAEACFRHALGVDEAAARTSLAPLRTKSETRSEQQQCSTFCTEDAGDFLHPRSASHLAAIAYSRLRVNGRTQAEALLHAALDAAASAAAVPPAARAADVDDVADDPDDERASFARVDSDPGEILNRLGLMYSHQGRLEEAAQRFERAIALGAARMRAASRDAEAAADPPAANGEDSGEKLAGNSPDDDAEADKADARISSRARKMHRRASLVASADASRRWRDASALTSAALANLGVLRFKAADPSSRARGGSASFFHRAWTYAENNPELGPSHPHTAWARGWFDIAGGYDAAASDAGRASASMLDAVFEGEWGGFNVRSALAKPRFRTARDSKSSIGIGTPAFRDGFETAWGVLAGETSAAVETSGVGAESAACEPCVVANDATPRKVPVLAELGSFSAGAAPTGRTEVSAAYPTPDAGSDAPARRFKHALSLSVDKTIGALFKNGSRDDRTTRTTHRTALIRPSVSVALERFRPTERAISSWRLFWSDADAAHAARLDDLDVDLALASIVDDVANGAVGKHSEKVFSRDFVDVTTRDEVPRARDEARKRSTAFAAAARRAARAAANASSFLFDDSVWARRCDGGDGRSLDAILGELGAGVGPYSTDPSDPSDPSDVHAKDDLGAELEDEDDDDFHAGTSSDETLENIERRTDAPVDPADSALVARSFVVALDVETEAERAANPENEFLEHYRARLASRLMRTKEDAEWRAKKLDIQNASSRETMRRIVRDGDLVGFGEDDPNDPNDPNERQGLTVSRERLDGREIVSTRVASIAGTRAAVDAAAAFFVDSSLEVGASFDTRFDTRDAYRKDDKDDGRLEEPFLWAPGEAERAAARKAALEDAARDAAAARDETRRETLTARRESLARDSRRDGVTARGRSGRDSLDSLADKNKNKNKRNASARTSTSEAARAAVEAASFAVRAAAEALAGGGDAAARADAVAAATRAARALARPNDGNGPPRERPSRPSTASKLEAFKKRREDRTSSRPGTAAARTPYERTAYERTAYFHERTERTDDDDDDDARFARDSRRRESRANRFVAADADDEPRIASPRSGYGSIPHESPSFSSHSPFVGVTRRRVASGNASGNGESRDFHLGGARVSTRLDGSGSLRSDDVVSVPVSRLLSWVDRGLAVRGDARTASADRLGGEGERASARAAEGEGAAAAAAAVSPKEAVSPKKFRQRFAEDVTSFRESDDRRSAKLGAMLDEERAFRTHNASARLLADLSAARGARRLRESADATPRAAATRKSPARAPRPASAAAAAAEKPRRPTLASRRPSSAAGFAANAPDDERVWKARMRARVEERRRKLFGVG